MNNLKSLLTELKNELLIVGSPLTDFFEIGLDRKNIELKISDSGLIFSEDIYDLYQWHNGLKREVLEYKTLGEMRLFGYAIFHDFDIAYQEYLAYSNANYWDKYLFPLFGSGGGDYYLIDCNKNSKSFSQLFYFSPGDPDFQGVISIYDSLNSLISTIIECYRTKVYYLDEDKCLETNYSAELEISKRLNPKSEFWNIS